MEAKVRKILANAYFIGGSPCSGKSSIAEALSKEFHLKYHKIDDSEFEHLQRSDPEKQPTMSKLSQMNWNEIWMRPVAEQVAEEFEFYRERLEMILADLSTYEEDDQLIIEGAALLPELVKALGVEQERVIYIVPAKEFQVEHYSQRGFIHGILAECTDPQQAFANWMERDHQFGKQVAAEAESFGMKVIYVDGQRSLQENLEMTREHFFGQL